MPQAVKPEALNSGSVLRRVQHVIDPVRIQWPPKLILKDERTCVGLRLAHDPQNLREALGQLDPPPRFLALE